MLQTVAPTPELLVWAREKAGFDIEEVKKSYKKIHEWEAGESEPTYKQLKQLSKKYKRPVALFFFSTPPDEPEVKTNFRSLPGDMFDDLNPVMRFLIRKAQIMQLNIEELAEARPFALREKFSDINHNDIAKGDFIKEVRDFLGVSLEDQFRWEGKPKVALKNWRNAIEEKCGVFVFKDSFDGKVKKDSPDKNSPYSGFCLYHDYFPIIYVNNTQSKRRQIFTLFHELAHILLQQGGVDMKRETSLEGLPKEYGEIERLCNAFAGGFLAPEDDFRQQIKRQTNSNSITADDVDGLMERLSPHYSVSKEVILRRLYDLKFISQEIYKDTRETLYKRYDEKKEIKDNSKGGNYYHTLNTYLSKRYKELTFRKYYRNEIGVEQVCDYFNVKISGVEKIEKSLFAS